MGRPVPTRVAPRDYRAVIANLKAPTRELNAVRAKNRFATSSALRWMAASTLRTTPSDFWMFKIGYSGRILATERKIAHRKHIRVAQFRGSLKDGSGCSTTPF